MPLPQDGYVPLKKPLSLHESPPPPPPLITPQTQSEHVSCAETKALRNWKVRMAQRSMQQNYICSKYLMNTSRAFSDVSRWGFYFSLFSLLLKKFFQGNFGMCEILMILKQTHHSKIY